MPHAADSIDSRWMRRALELAARGLGSVEPNPMVGCVLVRDGQSVGEGFHARFGGPHAEIAALRNCADASGVTAYVTLEPCCHHGKTPPCSEALIAAGVARVVVAMQDPFPRVAGGGLAQLRDRGIPTTVGVLEAEARQLNAAYLKRVTEGLPWVIAKWAMTADGRIATVSGQSQWITGEAARRQVHVLRGRMDAIAVGMGTVQADDPRLTARPPGPRTAARVVFCQHRLPSADSNLVRSAREAPLILVASPSIADDRLGPLQDAGAEVIRTNVSDGGEMAKQACAELTARRSTTNLMLEGGPGLLGSFADAGLIDECHVYIGAKLFGGAAAPGPVGGEGVKALAEATELQLLSLARLDDDVRLVYRRRA